MTDHPTTDHTARIVIPDATIRIDSMPAEGRTLRLVVEPAEREAIAAQLELSQLNALVISAHVSRFRGGLQLDGKLEARLVQPCVVTLEPVYQTLEEPLERVFLPVNKRRHDSQSEILVDVEGEDMPDYFDGNEIDLSEVIIETLALAIDPYPRAPGAGTAIPTGDPINEDESPFARLKALKDRES
jgi:uncharacterized metal-binding protein YceD (DUF177 family)